MNPEISIIIRAKNEEENIAKCLTAVQSQATDKAYEIIVIYDKTSTDNTLNIINNFKVRIINLQDHLPCFAMSSSLNLGAKLAKGKIIINLSGDAIPKNKNWLEYLIKPLSDKNVAGSSSRFIPKPGCNPIEAGQIFKVYNKTKKSVPFSNVSSAIKKEIWKKIKFDESLLSAEDRDWKNKLEQDGYKIAYAPNSIVYHSHNWPIKKKWNLGVRKGYSYVLQNILKPRPKNLIYKLLYLLLLPFRLFRRFFVVIHKDYKYFLKSEQPIKWYFKAIPYEFAYISGFYLGPLIYKKPATQTRNINSKKIIIACQKFGNEGLANYLFNFATRLKKRGYNINVATTYSSTWKEIIYKSPSTTKLKNTNNGIPIYGLGFSLQTKLKTFIYIPYLVILRKINIIKYNNKVQNLISIGFKKSINSISKNADYVIGIAAIRPHLLLAFQKHSNKPFYLFPLTHTVEPWSNYAETINVFNNSNKIFVFTNHENKWLINKGISKEKIKNTGMGLFLDQKIKPKPEEFKNKYNLKGNIILFIGRMRKEKFDKGYKELVESTSLVWKKHLNTSFVFIGREDKYANNYFSRIRDTRIINIKWATEQEKVNALAACDIFTMPSSSESFGEVFLEAWYFKKPVVGTNIEVSKEIIEKNKAGLIAERKPKDLAQKIITLLDNPDMREKMGENGFRTLQDKYNWEKIINKITS